MSESERVREYRTKHKRDGESCLQSVSENGSLIEIRGGDGDGA